MEYPYSNEQLLEMYYHLKRGRIFTLKMHDAVYKGLIRSSFHSPYGEEAVGVGIVSAMQKKDWMNLTHRLQTGYLMKYELTPFIAELFGLKGGLKHGAVFDYHLSDYSENGTHELFRLGTLGGVVAMSTGFAWTRKQRGLGEAVVIPHGDGGCSEGVVYEAWNLAALYKLPTVYVINNNRWAMTVPLRRQTANPIISEKAAACGLSTQVVDGNDILAVRRAVEIGLEKARNFEPNVVEVNTLRWEGHFVGQGNDYRDDKDAIAEGKEHNDCVKRYEQHLMEKGLIDQEYIDQQAAKIEEEIDAAVEAASKSDKPAFSDVYRKEYVYANPETGGDL